MSLTSLNLTDNILKKIIRKRLCLEKDDQFEIIKTLLEPYSKNEKNGYLGVHLRLSVTVQIKSNIISLNFFVKCKENHENATNSKNDKHEVDKKSMLYLINETQAFEKELIIYQSKNYKKDDWGPDMYFGNSDVIILNDLSEIGYTILKKNSDLDLEHCKVFLKYLARFHAYTYTKINQNICIQNHLLTRKKNSMGDEIFSHSLMCLKKMLKLDNLEFFKTHEHKFFEHLKLLDEIEYPSKKFENVICHGDLWINNFMFAYEGGKPTKCQLIDYQLIRRQPPAYDVLMFFYLNLSREFRQQHFHELLKYYFENFVNNLHKLKCYSSSLGSWAKFYSSCKYQSIISKYLGACLYKPMLCLDNKILKKVFDNSELRQEFLIINRMKYIEASLKNDQIYRKDVLEAVEEIKFLLKEDDIMIEDIYFIMEKYLDSKNYQIIDYKLNPLEKVGFLSDQNLLEVTYSFKNQIMNAIFFVKQLTKIENHRAFIESWDGFNKEIFIYDTIFKQAFYEFDKNLDFIPKNYLNRNDDVLIFENLLESGYKMLDNFKIFTYEELLVILKKLAKFHSLSLIWEFKKSNIDQNNDNIQNENSDPDFQIVSYSLKEFQTIYSNKNRINEYEKRKIIDFNRHYFIEPYYLEGDPKNQALPPLKGLLWQVDYFKIPNAEQLKEKITKIVKNFPSYVKPSGKYPNVVCHGDLFQTNIMYKFNEQQQIIDCKFIDFQSARYLPPAHDFLFFFYFVTKPAFQKKNLNQFIDIYYNFLNEHCLQSNINLETIFPRQEFYNSCKELEPFCCAQASIFHQWLLGSPEFFKKVYKDKKLMDLVITQNDRIIMLQENFKYDPRYKLRIKESIEALCQFCENWNN